MGRDGEKKTVRQLFLDWWLLGIAVILGGLVVRCLYLWNHRDYGQLTTSLITVLGVVVTLWMTQLRAIEQQEREDRRHHVRLEAEAKMHDERLRMESEREHKRLASEAQKDRVQRSITQRIDLAEKLASAVEHLSSENELKQAAGVQEILFQIDDWHTLIESEIAVIKGEGEGAEVKKVKLQQESLRHRQELFDIAYKFDTKNVELLKSRARGLKQRLVREDDHSLIGLDFSGMVIGWPGSAGENNFQIDLKELNAKNFIMSDSEMCYVDLSDAHLAGTSLANAYLEGADLAFAYLEGADLAGAYLEGARLACAYLTGASLVNAYLTGASLAGAHLTGASLAGAYLEGASLACAYLEGASLACAHLAGASLAGAHLAGADLAGAHLQGVDLRDVYFDQKALRDKKLLDSAEYDDETKFPEWLDPNEHGMQLVDETGDES